MEVSITSRLDKIQEFLNGFQKHHSYQLHEKHLYSIKSNMTAIKFLRATVLLSDTGEGIEDILKSLEDIISADFGESDFESDDIQFSDHSHSKFWKRDKILWSQVGQLSMNLTKLAHPFIADGDSVVFDQFCVAVQEFLLCLRENQLMCYEYSAKRAQVWVARTHSAVEGYCNATSKKLESFRCFVCSFSKLKNSPSLLARAGAVVASILGEAYLFDGIDKNSAPYEIANYSLRVSLGMSRKLSPHDEDVMEVYREGLETYAEILKASRDMVMEEESLFINLLKSAKNQVQILGDILDFPLMDLSEEKNDQTEDVEILLKQGYAAVAQEAGSLCSSINNIPNVVLSQLLHKLYFIKAEIFVLELHSQKENLPCVGQKRVTTIKEGFRFLSEFFKTPQAFMQDSEKSMLSLVEAFLRESTGSLCEDTILESSLAIFKLFKAEAKLMVLIDNISSLKFLAGFRIQTLHKSLIFLRAFLCFPPSGNLKDSSVSSVFDTLASKVASLVCSFGEMNQPMEINHFPSQLAGLFELNIEEIMAVYQQGPWSMFYDFPKSDGVVFVEHLVGKLRKLLTNNPDSIGLNKDQVDALLGKMEFFRCFLQDVKNKDLGLRVICLIYEAEHIIDRFILGNVPLWYNQLLLLIAIEEAKFIKAQIHKENFESSVPYVQLTSTHMISEGSNLRTEEVIVGLDDQAKIIAQRLQTGSKNLQTVSLVGMAGIGKTTLAIKVYSSYSIQCHFDVRSSCYVSQVYQKKELLLDILSDIVEVTDDIRRRDENDIATKVYQELKGKRYLILMDDIWRIETWNDLRNIFPNDHKGSRILFTTRRLDVASKAIPKIEPHVLPLLSPGQSWDLLQAKLFQGEKCPKQLLEVGRRIAENCRGLPLAIVVIAGILKRTEMKKDQWEEVAEQIRLRIADDQERQFMDILEFSYNNLPSYLKPCYLYLGIFLEDQEIPARKLQRLWIAEGFIPKIDSKSLEETAEGYLVELINRSLVMEAKRSSLGGTKRCRIHDMLRDLCLKKSKEENFMQLVFMDDEGFLIGNKYRLCVHSSKRKFIESAPSGSHVHSLLFFSSNNTGYLESCDISFILENFKLLRVLDLESFNLAYKFPSGIDLMLGLNYIAIKGTINFVPPSISKLWNLETLIVKGTRGEIALPSTLWSMATLRHVEVRPRASLNLSGAELENVMVLENLTNFSSPALSPGVETQKILKRWISLRKLRFIFVEHWYYSRIYNGFPALESLNQLVSLKIYSGGGSLPCKFCFPGNLRKLTLSKFRLPWEYISDISGRLMNLEVLKLLFRAFEGDTWDMTEGAFPKLKYLKLENLNLAKWNASRDNFPELERLVLRSCKRLEELPSGFGEVSTLQMIEVHWCSQSAAKSVETIYEQQLEYGNKDFEVAITPPEWNFRTSS